MHDDGSKIYVEKLETIVFHLDAFLDSPFLVNVAVNLSPSTKIDELTQIQAGRPGGDLEARGHRLLAFLAPKEHSEYGRTSICF